MAGGSAESWETFICVINIIQGFKTNNKGKSDILCNKKLSQSAFTCLKLTIKTLEQGVKYDES